MRPTRLIIRKLASLGEAFVLSRSSSTPYRGTALLIILGLAFRLLIAPISGYPDMHIFVEWAEAIADLGLIGGYQATTTNYPPISIGILVLSHRLFLLVSPTMPFESPVGLVLVKLPSIIADGAVIFLCQYLVEKFNLPRRAANPLLISLAWNPAMIFMSAWWAQYDSIYVALLFAAMVAALDDRPLWVGALLGIALMTKQQALFFIPVIGLALLARRITSTDLRPAARAVALTAAAFVVPVLLSLAPFIVAGELKFFFDRMIWLVASENFLTINALNLWFLIGGPNANWVHEAPMLLSDAQPVLLGLTYRQVGLLLLSSWLLITLIFAWRSRHTPAIWMLAAGLTALGIFMFPTQTRERYSLAAPAFYAAASLLMLLPSFNGASAVTDNRQLKTDDFPHNSFISLLLNSNALYAMISLGITFNLMWAAPPHMWVLLVLATRSYGLLGAAWMVGCTVWAIIAFIVISLRNPASSRYGENKPDEPGSI